MNKCKRREERLSLQHRLACLDSQRILMMKIGCFSLVIQSLVDRTSSVDSEKNTQEFLSQHWIAAKVFIMTWMIVSSTSGTSHYSTSQSSWSNLFAFLHENDKWEKERFFVVVSECHWIKHRSPTKTIDSCLNIWHAFALPKTSIWKEEDFPFFERLRSSFHSSCRSIVFLLLIRLTSLRTIWKDSQREIPSQWADRKEARNASSLLSWSRIKANRYL